MEEWKRSAVGKIEFYQNVVEIIVIVVNISFFYLLHFAGAMRSMKLYTYFYFILTSGQLPIAKNS